MCFTFINEILTAKPNKGVTFYQKKPLRPLKCNCEMTQLLPHISLHRHSDHNYKTHISTTKIIVYKVLQQAEKKQ